MFPEQNYRIKFAIFALIIPLVAMLAIPGCSVKKPESPSWITTWDVPISNKSYGVSDLLEKLDDSLFVTDSLGNPAFSVTGDIDTVTVGNSLTYEGVSIDFCDSIGTVDIAPPSNQSATTNVYDILPVALGVVPPTSFSYSQALPALDRFTWLEVQSGTLDLQFFNGLEIDLDTFAVTVIDQSDLHVVGVATYLNGLSYLETETQSIDISGQRISNTLFMNFDGHTPGGVLLNAGPQNLVADASFPVNITVTAGQTETPAINMAQSVSTSLSDSTRVVSSTVSSGTIRCDVFNGAQIPFTVDIASANFTIGGMPLRYSGIFYPGTAQVDIDLAGYIFQPSDSAVSQYIKADFVASAPASAPVQNTISASDSIIVNAVLSSITFSSVTGQIKPTPVTIDSTQQNIDIPQGLDQARLTQAVMNLNLYNNSMVPADIDLVISGGGNSINISDRIAPKGSPSAAAALTTITVGSQQLYDFLNPAPEQISISGQAVMNPDYGIATVTANDNFYGDFEIYSPFALAISDTISIDMDINDTSIDPDSRPDDFNNTFKYGTIDVEFESHLPLGISMTLYIGTFPDSTLYTDPSTLKLGPYTLNPGVTDDNGHVIESAISTIADSLDNNQLNIFNNDIIYFGQKINLLPTDPNGVQLLGQDYIDIKSNARIQLQVGDNLWNNQ